MTFTWSEQPITFNWQPPQLKEAPSGATWYETHDGRKPARASKVVNDPFDAYGWYEMCGGQKDGQLVSTVINALGTLTHSRVERYLGNKPAPKWNLPYVNTFFGGIQPLIDNISDISCLEQPLYSPSLGIAGTTDCIADYKGQRSIIDFKTSTKPKTESDIQSYFLQATLYSKMWQQMTGEKIDNIAILMTVSGGQYKEFTKRVDEPLIKRGRITCEEGLETKLTKFREGQG